jgi:hypothetical protein
MRSLRLTFALLGIALSAVSSAVAATPKKFYWTEPRAEAMVQQQVKIPECWVWPDNRCDNPPGPFWANGGERMPVATVDCTGSDEYRSSFTFNRFRCKIVINDGNGVPAAHGTIAVYVTGRAKLRWKLLS